MTPRRLGVGLVGCGLVAAEKRLPALVQLPDLAVVAVADRATRPGPRGDSE